MECTSSNSQCRCHFKIYEDLIQIMQSSNELKKSKAIASGMQVLIDQIEYLNTQNTNLHKELGNLEQNLENAKLINNNLNQELHVYQNSFKQLQEDKASLAEYVAMNENKIRNYDKILEENSKLKIEFGNLKDRYNNEGKMNSKLIEEITDKHNHQLNEIRMANDELINKINEMEFNSSVQNLEIKKLQMVIRSLNNIQRRVLLDIPKRQDSPHTLHKTNNVERKIESLSENILISDENKKTIIDNARSFAINSDIEDISREINNVETVIFKLSEQLKLYEGKCYDKQQINLILERIESESEKLIDLKKRFNVRYRELVNF